MHRRAFVLAEGQEPSIWICWSEGEPCGPQNPHETGCSWESTAREAPLHHSCINPSACLVCVGPPRSEPTIFTMEDLLNALKPKHTIAVSTEEQAERLRAALDEAGLRAEVVVNATVPEDQAIVMRNDLLTGPVPIKEVRPKRWICESPGLMPCTSDGGIRYSLRHSKCSFR